MTRPPVQQHGSRVQAGTRAAAAGPLIVHGLLASSMAAECRHTAKQQQVCGQISHRRRVSSKLVFYDLLQSDTSQWWEVVVKAGTYGDVQAVKDLRDSLKLGDCVEVTGWAEGDAGHSPTLQAVSIKVTQPWRLQSPALAFIPRPAPRAHKPQQQQAESPSQATATAAEAAPTGVQQDTSSPAAAARVSAPQVAVCKFWLNTGRCVKGTDCPYLHAVLPAAGGGSVSRRNCLRQREAERQQRSAAAGFVHNSSAAAKRQRARVFAAFLVQQYGKELLSSGAGVLDVAGGRGSLTFELACVHGVRCTLVDPRPLKLTKVQHKQLAGRSLHVSTLTMQQLQEDNTNAAHTLAQCEEEEQDQGCEEEGQTVDQQGLQAGLGAASPPGQQDPQIDGSSSMAHLHLQQVQAWFGPDLWGTPGWQRLFSDCSLVVGLHPDQATEPILDFAVQQRLPFAIMPCCVFPRLFPDRRLQQPDGSLVPVSSYEQLVAYLLQRGGAQRSVLDFEGANTVVYRGSGM